MTQNNNFSVLPWYLSLDEQNHKKSYAYGNTYPLFNPADKILPFQFMRATRTNAIANVRLYEKKSGTYVDITQQMKDTGLKVVRFPSMGYDVIVYPGVLPMGIDMKPGMYFLSINDGVQTFWSDIITVVFDVNPYTKIEWYDIENLVFDAGQIVYKNPAFKNVLYLSSEIGKPEYTFDEEGETRDGYFFPEKQISEKTYKCNILAPEYLCDVMRFIRMSDYVVVTDKYGRVYDCDTFLITPKWETQGDIASVEIEFQTNTVVKKIGRGFTIMYGGDFNNDFNDDYNNQNT